MSVEVNVPVIETQLWIQGDARDPLGIWGARGAATGDASAGEVRGKIFVAAERRSAFVYACYGATAAFTGGTITIPNAVSVRLLTNWPNVDPQAGVQGFGSQTIREVAISGSNAPVAGPIGPLIGPADRFILLFDPRSEGGAIDIVELKYRINDDLATYSFEAYGYYWDREVLNTPGGPRHPGSA